MSGKNGDSNRSAVPWKSVSFARAAAQGRAPQGTQAGWRPFAGANGRKPNPLFSKEKK